MLRVHQWYIETVSRWPFDERANVCLLHCGAFAIVVIVRFASSVHRQGRDDAASPVNARLGQRCRRGHERQRPAAPVRYPARLRLLPGQGRVARRHARLLVRTPGNSLRSLLKGHIGCVDSYAN